MSNLTFWYWRQQVAKELAESNDNALGNAATFTVSDDQVLARIEREVEERGLREEKVDAMLELVKQNHRLALTMRLMNASKIVTESFENEWIERTWNAGGLSRDDLEESGTSNDHGRVQDLMESWTALEEQATGENFSLEKAGQWYFKFRVHKVNKTFRLPYDPIALDVCNQLMYHYAK